MFSCMAMFVVETEGPLNIHALDRMAPTQLTNSTLREKEPLRNQHGSHGEDIPKLERECSFGASRNSMPTPTVNKFKGES